MKIAIQGEAGSFSHEAAMKLVPEAEIETRPQLVDGGLAGANRLRAGGGAEPVRDWHASPASVRARQSRWKREPEPKRSRSRA